MTPEKLFSLAEELKLEAGDIMRRKNHDYCGGADVDPFANFKGSTVFDIHPLLGLVLRMQDKLQRINTFAKMGTLQVQDEGLRDACVDLINYAVLAYGMGTDVDTVEESP